MKNRGFTLIELLVVISLVSLLSSIVYSGVSSARMKARDTARKMGLGQVSKALEFYFDKCDTYAVRQSCNTGAYYGSVGIGWFNYPSYSGSAGSVAQGLVDAGFLGGIVIDPSGVIAVSGSNTGYLIYVNASRYTLWAKLENPTAQDIATQNTCYFSTYDNYYGVNYCISN